MAMIFNSLIFGSINSADYGIYITGEAVYNAPERAVEMVKVPGRNGAIALDQGRWENVEVSYPAGCFGDDQSDFASKISDFRNAIVSQLGYQRLTDTYNPNEYRLGVYASGLDVKPTSMNRAGEFAITFDCKPQRFLTSGETEETVSSGDTLTNPTQYESSPLLVANGEGTIEFNGYEIELSNGYLGWVLVRNGTTLTYGVLTGINTNSINSGDLIIIDQSSASMVPVNASNVKRITSFDVYSASWSKGSGSYAIAIAGRNLRILWTIDSTYYNYGDVANLWSPRVTVDVTAELLDGTTATARYYFDFTFFCNGHLLGINGVTMTKSSGSDLFDTNQRDVVVNLNSIYADSTKSILGSDVYIDCDLGECYKYDNGNLVNLNHVISLGSDLPELASGSNTITFDNTITSLKITPRWWKL